MPAIPVVPDHGFARIPVRAHVVDRVVSEFNPQGPRHEGFLAQHRAAIHDSSPDPITSFLAFLASLPCVSVQSLYTVGAALHI